MYDSKNPLAGILPQEEEQFMSVDPSLAPSAPLSLEELAMASAPSATPASADSMILKTMAPPVDTRPEERTVDGLMGEIAKPRNVQIHAPQVDLSKYDKDDADAVARRGEFASSLKKLKADYDVAKENARSRQMKAEMMAAIGNNIGNIVGGAQAMNTKASVSIPQTSKIEVKDMVGRVDKNHKDSYEALLKQYKDLQDGGLTAKDKLYADISNKQMQMQGIRAELNAENQDRGIGMRFGSASLSEQEKNEVSNKQLESLTGFAKTAKLLDDIEVKVSTGTYDKFLGPYASKYENSKEYNPMSNGMDPEFASFQSDTTDSLSQYIKGLSGLTVSDKERIALETSMPKVGDKPSSFLSKLKATRARLKEMEKIEKDAIAKYQAKNTSGYKGKGSANPEYDAFEAKMQKAMAQNPNATRAQIEAALKYRK